METKTKIIIGVSTVAVVGIIMYFIFRAPAVVVPPATAPLAAKKTGSTPAAKTTTTTPSAIVENLDEFINPNIDLTPDLSKAVGLGGTLNVDGINYKN